MWLRWAGVISVLVVFSATVHAAGDHSLSSSDDRQQTTERRGDVVRGSSNDDISRNPHRRVAKQISHRLQLQANAQRSAAIPAVGQASTTLLVRQPLAVRRQLAPPRSPPRFEGFQPHFDQFQLRNQPAAAVRRAQMKRLPLSQASNVHRPNLFPFDNQRRTTPMNGNAENFARQGTQRLPPVEPPRHWNRQRTRLQLLRPTNNQLTDLRALSRATSSNDATSRGEQQAQSMQLASESDIERAVIKAIIDSSTAMPRRRGRIRRPSHRGRTSRPFATKKSGTTMRTTTVRTASRIATVNMRATRPILRTTVRPITRPIIETTTQIETMINSMPFTTPITVSQPILSTTASPQQPFSTSRRRITSLLNQGPNRERTNNLVLQQQSNTSTHHPFTSSSLSAGSTANSTLPPPSAGSVLADNPISTFIEPDFSVVTPSHSRIQPEGPNRTTLPAVDLTQQQAVISTNVRDSVEPFNFAQSSEVAPESNLNEDVDSVQQKPSDFVQETTSHKNLIDHSTSNEESFDIDPTILNEKALIVAPLKKLPLTEVVEGSADFPDADTLSIEIPVTVAPPPTSTTVDFSILPTSPPAPPPETSNQEDAPPISNVFKENLKENFIQENTTPTLIPPPSPSPVPSTSIQEIGAPGAAPPNDSVVDELNRAENFMEVARRLRILRSQFRHKRQIRSIKVDGDTSNPTVVF